MLLFLSSGCSSTFMESRIKAANTEGNFTLTEISRGLPTKGLWRNNIALYDVNNDGFMDIIAPPPRKAKHGNRRPFIFVWDEKISSWMESDYKFPEIKGYNYGGVAVGDIDRDGFFDLALANHTSRIIILINDRNNGFKEMPFSPDKDFYSRTIKLADLNNDGWLDIIAVSEAPFVGGYTPSGILLGMNLDGKEWDISFVEKSYGIYSDSLHTGDYNGDREKDIALAPLSARKTDKKLIFFGKDGYYEEFFDGSQLTEKLIPFICSSGDYDGDNIDELVYYLTGFGRQGKGLFVKAYKWNNNTLNDISKGLITEKRALAFASNDFDNDGMDELLALSYEGLHIFKYSGNAWDEIFFREMGYEKNIAGIYGVTSERLKDGSYLIVYNLGSERDEINGIRGYVLKWQED